MFKPAIATVSGLALLAFSAATASAETLLPPTPLILKDGRISQVTIHTLAFPLNQSTLGPQEQDRLDALAASVATDCFLTAQSVGHASREESTAQPADAHRLARARADEVQRALVDVGLPVDAIASVWDWQFLVDAPRSTLWVFALAEGEDCTGAPLRADQVASAELTPSESDAPATAPAAMPAAATAPAEPAESAPPTETAAASPPPTTAPVPTPARSDSEAMGSATTAVVFESNSSFFSDDAEEKLRAFLAEIPNGQDVRILLGSSIGRGDVRGASSEEQAVAYNRWLATRRADRIREWLDANGGDRTFTFQTAFVPDDARQVAVTAEPAG